MNYSHLLEALMLVCFGISWPLNVIKSYKAKTAKGTSLAFIILIVTGYVSGITAKIINRQFNYVLGVYFLNLAIVLTNIFVYIRNKSLDKKVMENNKFNIKKLNILQEEQGENMLNYSNSLDDLINRHSVIKESKNAVLLIGGTMDKEIPASYLAKDFDFNFALYNKSEVGLTLKNACSYYEKNISALSPEGIIFHLGAEDEILFKNDPSNFDTLYLRLIGQVKAENKKCRIALVSINNPGKDKTISLLNAHIKAISEAEGVSYINLENAKLWNPESLKAASKFAYSMGLSVRKPLRDVAEILYSYAYHNIDSKICESQII